jgi:uncharacterized membrane protein
MPIPCPDCAAEMPDTAAYCPGCGRSMIPVERARGMVGILPEALAGALAYFLLPAIVFLFVEPYKKNRFVRFHSFQCLGFFLAGVILVATLRVLGFLLYLVPVIGHPLVWLVSMVVGLAFFMIWAVLVVKALQGEMFKLPLLGEFAEQQTPAA